MTFISSTLNTGKARRQGMNIVQVENGLYERIANV